MSNWKLPVEPRPVHLCGNMESDTSPQIVDAEGSTLRQVSAAVLLIVGEPTTADHKNLILGEITKGIYKLMES